MELTSLLLLQLSLRPNYFYCSVNRNMVINVFCTSWSERDMKCSTFTAQAEHIPSAGSGTCISHEYCYCWGVVTIIYVYILYLYSRSERGTADCSDQLFVDQSKSIQFYWKLRWQRWVSFKLKICQTSCLQTESSFYFVSKAKWTVKARECLSESRLIRITGTDLSEV